MPSVRSPWILACAALCCACGGEPAEPRALEHAPVTAAAPATVDPRLYQRLSDWIAKDWSALRTTKEEKCDDSRFEKLPVEARTLVLAVRDARFEKKQLLPLDLTGSLTEPKLHALRDELALLPRGHAPRAEVSSEVAALEQRRFVGVFHVTEHFGAERVFRVDRGRWEWLPGTLVAWLAIHDASSGAALCQTLLVVKNDTRGAPLAVRLKSDTRERLMRELGRDVRAEALPALRRISALLELPDAPQNNAQARR